MSTIITEWTKLSRKDDCTDEELKRFLEPNLRSGNTSRKPTRITDSNELLYEIRAFILHKRAEGARFSAPEVLSFLIEIKKIDLEQNTTSTYNNSEYKSALRATQRYLKRNGFLRGRRTGGLKINIEHIAWRNQYLRTILENGALPRSQR